jgi:hypothetical protein
MRLEDELLICCARVSLGPHVQARIEALLREPLDWQILLKRAHWHRIRPLVDVHLRAQPAGFVPDDVLKKLGDSAGELADRNQRLSRTLDEIAALCEDRGLRLLAYKGPTLATDAYGELNLRECGDLDVLVHQDELHHAVEMLKSSGFSSVRMIRQSGEWDFQRNRVSVDLHWDLAPWWLKYRVDFDRLWEDGVPLAGNSVFARKLRPEDSLVVLCIHGIKHLWERLRWICDVAEVVNRGFVTDWDRVEARAAEMNSRRSVALGLRLAGDLLSAKLPAEMRRELDQSPVLGRLAAQVGTWLQHGKRVEALRKSRDRLLFRMMVNDRRRDRLPQLGRNLLARLACSVQGAP